MSKGRGKARDSAEAASLRNTNTVGLTTAEGDTEMELTKSAYVQFFTGKNAVGTLVLQFIYSGFIASSPKRELVTSYSNDVRSGLVWTSRVVFFVCDSGLPAFVSRHHHPSRENVERHSEGLNFLSVCHCKCHLTNCEVEASPSTEYGLGA